MFIEYLPRQTYLHRLDIRTKLIGFIGIVILAFMFKDPLYNLAIAILVGILAFSIRMPLKKIYDLLSPLAPVFILIMLFSGLNFGQNFHGTNGTALFYLLPGQHLGVTRGGLLTGCTFVIRIFTMVIASSIVTLTTPIDDFIQLLNKMKVPYEFSFIITTAIRFIPTMNKKRMLIIDAQKARGAKLEEKGIFRQIKNYIPIMVPMIINSILMANTLSMAMLNRGFGYTRSWTSLKELSFTKWDYLTIIMIILMVISGIYLRFGLNKGFFT